MALIFIGSTDLLSSQHTSRFLVPFLHWLMPWLSDDTLGRIQFMVRKGGHVSEYALLAVVFWRALRRPVAGDPRPWSRRTAGVAVLGATLYAVTDEVHQSFVASRFGSAWDVLLDGAGAAAAMMLVWWIHRRRQR